MPSRSQYRTSPWTVSNPQNGLPSATQQARSSARKDLPVFGGAASNVKVTGDFADRLLRHLQAEGFVEEELDWFWNSNGTVGLRFDDPLPTVS